MVIRIKNVTKYKYIIFVTTIITVNVLFIIFIITNAEFGRIRRVSHASESFFYFMQAQTGSSLDKQRPLFYL